MSGVYDTKAKMASCSFKKNLPDAEGESLMRFSTDGLFDPSSHFITAVLDTPTPSAKACSEYPRAFLARCICPQLSDPCYASTAFIGYRFNLKSKPQLEVLLILAPN
jgi:hypothetical protein